MKNQQPTMQDVADAAGFSRTAVCFALRNDPRLPIATRRHIQQAARRLGYRPNPLVSALMANLAAIRAKPITAVIAYASNFANEADFQAHPQHQAYFRGASQRAARSGYRVEPFFFQKAGITAARLSQILRTRHVSGLLLAPLREVDTPLTLKWNWFASVCIGMRPDGVNLHRVNNDMFQALHFGLRRLRALGYRRIGLVIHRNWNQYADYAWSASFQSFAAEIPRSERVPCLQHDAWPTRALGGWIEHHHPDVVVSDNLKIVDVLLTRGLKVPRDIGFFHIDIPPGARGISGLDQKRELIGAAAADLVIEQLYHNERGCPTYPKSVLLPSAWVPGRTIRRNR